MRATLVLFARAPRLGTVKRRLARGVGAPAALRFHRGQLLDLARRLGRDRRWRTVLAVTPDATAHRGTRWPAGIPRRGQGRGDLGARMARALAPHRLAVLVGSDIPGIRPGDIAAAFRALRAGAPAVFGPARDGGYWLVGFGPRRRPPAPFAGVRWSTGHALADTLRNCRGGPRPPALVRALRDVDTAADLAALRGGGVHAMAPAAGPGASRGRRLPPEDPAAGPEAPRHRR